MYFFQKRKRRQAGKCTINQKRGCKNALDETINFMGGEEDEKVSGFDFRGNEKCF